MPSLGRLHLITDTRPGRDPLAVLRAALPVARAELVVQVRVTDDATDREAYDLARRAVALCAPYEAMCLVNDRLHVALAVGAAGGDVGADDLPVAAARRVLGPTAVLGATARAPG
ncbi:thiamine phosphate synthase, partial [Micromonospora harpali]